MVDERIDERLEISNVLTKTSFTMRKTARGIVMILTHVKWRYQIAHSNHHGQTARGIELIKYYSLSLKFSSETDTGPQMRGSREGHLPVARK